MLTLQKTMNQKRMESMIFKIILQTNQALKHCQSNKKVEYKEKTEKEKKMVDIQKTQNTITKTSVSINVLNVNELNIFIKIEMVISD